LSAASTSGQGDGKPHLFLLHSIHGLDLIAIDMRQRVKEGMEAAAPRAVAAVVVGSGSRVILPLGRE
jgi:hypothetical protein